MEEWKRKKKRETEKSCVTAPPNCFLEVDPHHTAGLVMMEAGITNGGQGGFVFTVAAHSRTHLHYRQQSATPCRAKFLTVLLVKSQQWAWSRYRFCFLAVDVFVKVRGARARRIKVGGANRRPVTDRQCAENISDNDRYICTKGESKAINSAQMDKHTPLHVSCYVTNAFFFFFLFLLVWPDTPTANEYTYCLSAGAGNGKSLNLIQHIVPAGFSYCSPPTVMRHSAVEDRAKISVSRCLSVWESECLCGCVRLL